MVRAFMKGMQAGVIAMLADIIISMWKGTAKGRDPYPYIVIILSAVFVFSMLFTMLISAFSVNKYIRINDERLYM